MDTKKRILVLTTLEGHLSIGQAIEQYLATQSGVSVRCVVEDLPMRAAYLVVYQFLPFSYKTAYSISKKSSVLREHAYNLFRMKYDQSIESHLDAFKPDAVVCCFYALIPSLVAACRARNIPIFNVITDPLTIHLALIAPPPTVNVCFDKKARSVVKDADPTAIAESVGWFARAPFEESYDKAAVRRELSLDPHMLTILVASGSEGTNLVMKIMPILLLSDKPAQVVVACGNNTLLQSLLEQFKKLLETLGNSNRLTILGFTDQMHKYMQAADLVVGKAGPNSLFESVATRTPFFAITHISGQEDGNLDIIRSYKLGYVEENVLASSRLLKSIIDNPKQLQKFDRPLEKLASYNMQAKQKLFELIRDALEMK